MKWLSRSEADRIGAKFSDDADQPFRALIAAGGRKPLKKIAPEVLWDISDKDIPGDEYFKLRVRSAAHRFLNARRFRRLPSGSRKVQDMRTIRLAIDRILSIYNRGANSTDPGMFQADLLHSLYRGGSFSKRMRDTGRFLDAEIRISWPKEFGERQSLLNSAMEGLFFLRDAALHEEWWRREVLGTQKGERSRGDVSLRELIDDLAEIWTDCFGVAPGLSRYSELHPQKGQPTGPFFRFVSEMFNLLEISSSAEALATRISRALHGQTSKSKL